MRAAIKRICLGLGRNGRTVAALLAWSITVALVTGAAALFVPLKAWAAEPQIVARVNGEAVTGAEFRRMRANPLTLRQLQQELGVQDPDSKELDRLALRKLIERRLMLQEASLKKFTVTEKELDNAIAALRRSFKDLRSFGEWMREQGIDDKSLFDVVRGDILTNRVGRALVANVRISDEEVQQYYQAQKRGLGTAGSVRLRIIAVKDKGAAEEIVAALKKGADFGRLARQRSIGQRATKGGDTGWVSPLRLPPPLREVVGALQAGETSGPVPKGAEFLIVRLVERRPARFKDLAKVQPQLREHLLAAKQREVYQGWLVEQEKKAKIEVFLP